MEPKLTIEHLKSYLGHKLMFQYSNKDIPPEEMTCDNIGMLTTQHDSVFKKVIHKPLLHPLSMLTKPIEHNGERIKVADFMTTVNYGFAGMQPPNEEILMNRIKTNTLLYKDAEVLFKYHFDVFGLIDQGLALPKQEA